MLERMRLNSFCGVSMRRMTLVVGIWTAVQSLVLIFLGGYYLYESFKTGNHGTTHFSRLPYRFETYRAIGALYLAFGAVWVIITLAYAAAYLTYRPLWFLPWLVLEAISIVLAFANMLSTAIGYKDRDALYGIIGILLSLATYPIVFSYYMELRDDRKSGGRPQEYKPVSL